MALSLAELEAPLAADPAGDRDRDRDRAGAGGGARRCRGRPRLTDSDRAQRRLESRKKYDVRRVYLGEAHKLWSEVRRRTGLSDAGLAEYLILLNATYGEKYRQQYFLSLKYGSEFPKKPKMTYSNGRNQRVSSLQSLVCWYQEHSCSCRHEPQLRALEPQPNFSTAAIWQCDSHHSFVQYLFSSPRAASDSEHEEQGMERKKMKRVQRKQTCLWLKLKSAGREGRTLKNTALPHGYECVTVASLADKLEKTDSDSELSQSVRGSVGPRLQEEDQSELFDPQTLQTVVTSCEIPDHRTLIIITGPSYEALTSEGIQLNMGGGNVEEVTCTVIGGVTFNQVCTSDPKLQTADDEDSMTGALRSRVLLWFEKCVCVWGGELTLTLNCELSLPVLCFCSVRSKRNRRGPVIEADGMLKMFHCPYEGCSQVYVAISSFQNHVNLVHRKGRTKVCPHPGCGKKFYLSNHLHRHMIIHSGVRDFICETCGKSFKRKNHLEVHRRTHTGETPLQCEICGYQCRQRASLNWHMKKHTPEAHYNFTCEFCDKRFEKLDSVKFHKLKSHPDKQAT
uniref:Zinc finger protein 653 n=1 Tax=Sander lucioperca TaxID=283035 RepID=A0A8D0DC55_SANLU